MKERTLGGLDSDCHGHDLCIPSKRDQDALPVGYLYFVRVPVGYIYLVYSFFVRMLGAILVFCIYILCECL